MISGSPWFQYRGNHRATYNVLKAVVNQGNRVTLIYPTKNYEMELDNAREMMEATSPGLEVIPVDTRAPKLARYYRSGKRIIANLLTKPNVEQITDQFSDYLNYDNNLNKNFVRAISAILEREAFDLIHVDYPVALKAVAALAAHDKPKVFVNHEIQAIRAQRTLQPDGHGYEKAVQQVRNVEGHFLKQYDAVIALTAVDSKKLNELYSIDAFVSPHAVDTDFWRKRKVIADHRRLVFSGGESHYPNRDAVEWLCRNIMPILDQHLDNYKIYITGKWSKKTKKNLSSPRVIFTGYIEDMRDYLSGSISLAPIRIGSGMRVKILEAMAMECIVVSTAIGCEGLRVTDGKHLLVANSAVEIAEKVSLISQNIEDFNAVGVEARRFVEKNYGIEATGKRRVEVFKQILERRPTTDSTF